MKPDLYTTLGVGRDASPEEIKKAHRRAAKRLHPDKNNGKRSEEFLAVQRAYDTLGDEEKRKRYDETGQTEGRRFSVENELADMFDQILQKGGSPELDLVEMAKRSVIDGMSELEKQREKLTRRAADLRKTAKRLRYKKNKLVHEILEGKAKTLDETAARIPEQVEFGKLLLKTLEEMDYDSVVNFDASEDRQARVNDLFDSILRMAERKTRSRSDTSEED